MANTNIYAMTDSWNNAGVVFTAIRMDVTDTASNASSLLLDLLVGGVSKASIDKNGKALFANSLLIPNSVSLNGIIGGVTVAAGNVYSFGSSNVNSPDVLLWRDAAGVLAQRDGINPQTSRLYNTFTDASNGEWFGLDWKTTANVARLRMVANGTGTARPIAIDAFQKAGAAVAGDIPTGTFAVVRDTAGLTTKLIYNNAGTLMTVALA